MTFNAARTTQNVRTEKRKQQSAKPIGAIKETIEFARRGELVQTSRLAGDDPHLPEIRSNNPVDSKTDVLQSGSEPGFRVVITP